MANKYIQSQLKKGTGRKQTVLYNHWRLLKLLNLLPAFL